MCWGRGGGGDIERQWLGISLVYSEISIPCRVQKFGGVIADDQNVMDTCTRQVNLPFTKSLTRLEQQRLHHFPMMNSTEDDNRPTLLLFVAELGNKMKLKSRLLLGFFRLYSTSV